MADSESNLLPSMEIHPFLERGVIPNHHLWYVLSAAGDSPSMRIGHTCTHIPSSESNGKLYFIGGANPSGAFAEVCVLDLSDHTWDTVSCSGLKARYEHSAFVPFSHPEKIYMFGGADQFGSFNDIQVFDANTKTCGSIVCSGTPPSPRTFHNGPCVGDKFIVYSGGDSGINPVGDRQVYMFDAVSNIWSTLHASGSPPKPRLGHLMVATGDKVFVHGGMSGTTFYDDLHVLDLAKKSWNAVRQKKLRPPPRTGHGAFVSDSDIYIFGGMNNTGALDDMYKLNSVTMEWTKVEMKGSPPPHNRLDFATCVFSLKIHKSHEVTTEDQHGTTPEPNGKEDDCSKVMVMEYGDRSSITEPSADVGIGESAESTNGTLSERSAGEKGEKSDGLTDSISKCSLKDINDASSTSYTTVEVCLVHGGTDTGGEIFDDCLVLLLRNLL